MWIGVVAGEEFAVIGGYVSVERMDVAEDGRRAFAVVDDGKVRLPAELDPRSLRFAQRQDVSPVLAWLEVHEGIVIEAAEGMATLDVELPKWFEAAARPVVKLACTDLTPFYEGRVSFPEEALKPGVRTPLSVRPGGPVVGHFVGPRPAPPGMPTPSIRRRPIKRRASPPTQPLPSAPAAPPRRT